jgi:hypothetical protein
MRARNRRRAGGDRGSATAGGLGQRERLLGAHSGAHGAPGGAPAMAGNDKTATDLGQRKALIRGGSAAAVAGGV